MKAKRVDRLAWFRKARFGMFIHWGLFSVPAGEWKGERHGEWMLFSANIPGREYEGLAKRLNPVKFDADKWVSLAKEAGMKYLVITTKHHEGFCMYDTKQTDYNIVKASPYGRDPIKDLARACRKHGITLCLYYSVKDWHHPEYPVEATWRTKQHPDGFHSFPNPKADYLKYLDYMQAQLRELLTNYGRVGIIWFDWGIMPDGAAYMKKAAEIGRMMRRLQPGCLVNNRFGGIKGDYGTPEQTIPGSVQREVFETCMTLNDSWGYSRQDHNWKDPAVVVHNLVDVVQKGGNYLLNVGPTAEGVIPVESVKILKRVGKWLKGNGESIYGAGTSGFHTKWLEDIGAVTARPGRLYLHVFKWPADRKLFFYDFKKKRLLKAFMLADPKKRPLKVDVHSRSLMIHLPWTAPDPLDSVIVMDWREKR